ncbi:MAG: KEOPS complex subunit Pcc1 [Methanomassiliicoccales archaeon]
MKCTAIIEIGKDAPYLLKVIGQEKGIPGCSIHWSESALQIETEDMGALRAALNSYIRWMHIALEMRDMVGKEAGR